MWKLLMYKETNLIVKTDRLIGLFGYDLTRPSLK